MVRVSSVLHRLVVALYLPLSPCVYMSNACARGAFFLLLSGVDCRVPLRSVPP